MSRPRRTGFLSYARDDSRLVERFASVLRPRLATRRECEIELWTDRRVLTGGAWRDEIGAAMTDADFGLLCLTPSFLASSFVSDVELPALMGEGEIVIPVAIEPLDVTSLDMKGIDALQIFQFRPPATARGLSFDECRGVNAKRFCDQLVADIVTRLEGARSGA